MNWNEIEHLRQLGAKYWYLAFQGRICLGQLYITESQAIRLVSRGYGIASMYPQPKQGA